MVESSARRDEGLLAALLLAPSHRVSFALCFVPRSNSSTLDLLLQLVAAVRRAPLRVLSLCSPAFAASQQSLPAFRSSVARERADRSSVGYFDILEVLLGGVGE